MWKWIYLNVNFSHCVDPILYTVESLESDSKVNLVTHKNYDYADWITITLGAQKSVKLSGSTTWTPQYNISLMKPWLKADFLGERLREGEQSSGMQKSFNHPMLSLQLGNIITFPYDVAKSYGDKGRNGVVKIFTATQADAVTYFITGQPASKADFNRLTPESIKEISRYSTDDNNHQGALNVIQAVLDNHSPFDL